MTNLTLPSLSTLAATLTLGTALSAQDIYAEMPAHSINNPSTYWEFADLDGDGDLDFLHTTAGVYQSRWYANPGDGRFDLATEQPLAPLPSRKTRAADIDNDGDVDVVMCASFGISLVRNLGGGTFAAPLTISTQDSRSCAVADIDGDGDLDIIGNGMDPTGATGVYWFEQAATGTFTPHFVDDFGGNEAKLFEVADMDNDGDADIVAASDAEYAWFENLGGGAFPTSSGPTAAYHHIHGNAEWQYDLEVADFNEDGLPDVLANASANAAALSLAVNNGNGFDLIDYPEFPFVLDISTGDADGDGHVDALISNYYGMFLMRNDPANGGLQPGQDLLPPFSSTPEFARFVDLDGDGYQDIHYSPNGYYADWLQNIGPNARNIAYGSGCYTSPTTGTPLSLSTTQAPVSSGTQGSTVDYRVDGLPTSAGGEHAVVVLVSFSMDIAGFSLDYYGATGCTAYVFGTQIWSAASVAPGESATLPFALPPGLPHGLDFAAQAVALLAPGTGNAAGFVTSNGVRSYVAEN